VVEHFPDCAQFGGRDNDDRNSDWASDHACNRCVQSKTDVVGKGSNLRLWLTEIPEDEDQGYYVADNSPDRPGCQNDSDDTQPPQS
jgi:hypothetical protein